MKTQEYKDLQVRSIPYEVRFFRYWLNNYTKDYYKGGARKFKYSDQLTSKNLWDMFKKFQSSENEKLGYITRSNFLNDMDKHQIRDSSMTYLKANDSHILNLNKTKQKYYSLDVERCKQFFINEGVDYNEVDFIPSSDEDTDYDTEDDE